MTLYEFARDGGVLNPIMRKLAVEISFNGNSILADHETLDHVKKVKADPEKYCPTKELIPRVIEECDAVIKEAEERKYTVNYMLK